MTPSALFTAILAITAAMTLGTPHAAAQPASADRIVALVNEKVILKSDVDEEIGNYLQQARLQGAALDFTEILWYQALESMIDNEVMLVQAKIDSIIVSDDQVNRQMDARISDLVGQAGSEQALERAFGKSIAELRLEFRELFREQMTVSQLQSSVVSKITITRPEVEAFFRSIPSDSLPVIPEKVAISQIVFKAEPSKDIRDAAYAKASAIRDSILSHGRSFEEMAILHSEGPSAQRGGLIPMIPLDDLVAEYAAAASALQPGEISTVVETEFGFHVIRLNRRQGDQIETNNILIKLDTEQYDDESAISAMSAVRDSLIAGQLQFETVARTRSQDPQSAPAGGRLYSAATGERLIAISSLDPSLYRIVLLLDSEGDISEPKPFNLDDLNASKAYRIVRLDRTIPEHRANLEQDYAQIEQIALQRKQNRHLSSWLEEIRSNVYIEYFIEVPTDVTETAASR